MFKEKGVILRSGLADNIKVTLALWPRQEGHEILAKPTVRRLNKSGTHKGNQPYKTWLSTREVYGMITTLQRAAALMEEYYDGTLDLTHLLAEDEDARMFTRTESVMYPTIDGMFDMTEAIEKEKEDGSDTNPNADD